MNDDPFEGMAEAPKEPPVTGRPYHPEDGDFYYAALHCVATPQLRDAEILRQFEIMRQKGAVRFSVTWNDESWMLFIHGWKPLDQGYKSA
jgi:hypothetical protein